MTWIFIIFQCIYKKSFKNLKHSLLFTLKGFQKKT